MEYTLLRLVRGGSGSSAQDWGNVDKDIPRLQLLPCLLDISSIKFDALRSNLILMQSHLLHITHRSLQLPYTLAHPPFHLFSNLLVRSLDYVRVGSLQFREFLPGGRAVFFCVDGVVLGFFGCDFKLHYSCQYMCAFYHGDWFLWIELRL